MTFRLTGDQELMRDSVRKIVERLIAPALAKHDPNRSLPKDEFLRIFAALAELGLTAARLPEEAGGPGIAMVDYGIMFEEIPAAVAVSLVAQEATVARLYDECSEGQRERFLPDLIAGRKIGCTGSTEPGTGSDPRGVATRLTRDGDCVVLNGRKMWISNVSACDLILVTCVDQRDGSGRGSVVKVVVERDRSPFEAREIDTIGLRQGMLGEAVFEDCRIPAENVVESRRGGTEVLKSSWAVNRPLFGLIAVGIAQKAYDMALDYAKIRKQFGKPIAAHQLIQKTLSDIVTAITTSRLLCLHALDMIDHGDIDVGVAAMAKRHAQNACNEAVWQAMNVFGAIGLSTEAKIEQLLRDVRMIPIPDGTNEILALIHGRALTGFEAFRGLPPGA
ncbi:MAG: acyl-CoA/acyl-ACP dehydrogenase [Alphaproteobacteria bacterium]|nr:acyl-CoA/acyl-ACP dehydrogenase [Alphaproteobacteria bacterium]